MSSVRRAYSKYSEYLKHPTFLAVKEKVLERDGHACVICSSTLFVQPHHLCYPKWGTFDVPDNLITVCYACHCVIEGKNE